MTRVSRIAQFASTRPLLRQLALASVVANVVLVGTGGAVRLTDSGLGCPTWPRCTDESYIASAAMGIHGAIEFGNRMLGFAVGAIALAGLVAALLERPRRRVLVALAFAVLLGIPAQAVVGGMTVLTDLNPWVVGLHFLSSMGVLAAAYALWRRTGEPDAGAGPVVPGPLRALTWLIVAVTGAVLIIGTFVTGSGPHAGDAGAHRNGLDPATIAQAHADGVFLLVGLSVALYLAARAVGAAAPARAALVLVAVELGQGLIGFVQYLTHLPALLVDAHMLGSCLVWLAALAALGSTRRRGGTSGTRSADDPAGAVPAPEAVPTSAGPVPAPTAEPVSVGSPAELSPAGPR